MDAAVPEQQHKDVDEDPISVEWSVAGCRLQAAWSAHVVAPQMEMAAGAAVAATGARQQLATPTPQGRILIMMRDGMGGSARPEWKVGRERKRERKR